MRRLLPSVCAVAALAGLPASAPATDTGDLDCSAFSVQAAAQQHLDAHPGDPDRLEARHP